MTDEERENKHYLSQIELGEWYSNAQYYYRPRNDKEKKLMHSCYEEGYNTGLSNGLAEGRKENEKLKEQIKLIESVSDANADENAELKRDKTELVNSVTELKNKITELEKQIEAMKCCGNCKNRMHELVYDDLIECKYGLNESYQKDCENWELVK
ncbi:MAG: hypothetical protein MJ174_07500 [Treponema sp.]|nr:hypothetical protein [Treponema sp.]